MNVVWWHEAWQQYTGWQDKKMVRRINALIEDISRGNDGGIGKPELLSGELSGWASRRISQEHRLVYRVREGNIEIISCRWHYGR